MAPVDRRDQVDPRQNVAVLEAGAQAITPGPVGGKTIIRAVLVGNARGHGVARHAVFRTAATEGGVTPQAFVAQVLDVHHAELTEQAQARGAEDVVVGLGRRPGHLPDPLAHPAVITVALGGAEARRQVDPGTAARPGNHRHVDVRCVDRQRHVRPVADFTRQGNSRVGLDAVETEAIQANVLRERGGVARILHAAREGPGLGDIPRIQGEVRQARVVVDEVNRRFRVVQRRDHVAQGKAELTIVGRRFIAPGGGVQTGILHLLVGLHLAQVQRPAALLDRIAAGEEGAATVEHALAPVVLIKAFQVQAVGQAEAEGQHLHRQLAFLDFHAGAVECRDVQRVDHVDAVLDQQCLTPGQHLVADLDVQRPVGDHEVFPDIGVQGLEALELGQVVPARVIEILEPAVTGFVGMVVPVLEADKGPLPLTVEAEVRQALEVLRDRVAALEIQPVVVGADAGAVGLLALRLQGVGAGHHALFRVLGGPTAAQGQGGLGRQAPVFIEVQRGRLGGRDHDGQYRQCERMRSGVARPFASRTDAGVGRACSYHY
ncbi:hypothetical protein D3C78_711940 [compost metagenome]